MGNGNVVLQTVKENIAEMICVEIQMVAEVVLLDILVLMGNVFQMYVFQIVQINVGGSQMAAEEVVGIVLQENLVIHQQGNVNVLLKHALI